jgi:hypothetical protein
MAQDCAYGLSEFLANQRSKYKFKAEESLKTPLFNTTNVPCSLALIISQQDRKHMYNVSLRHVCITTIAVEKQSVLNVMIVCILALVIWHANHIFFAMYYIAVCGLSGSTIFFYIIS